MPYQGNTPGGVTETPIKRGNQNFNVKIGSWQNILSEMQLLLIIFETDFMKKLHQISFLLLFIGTITLSGCSVFGKSNYKKQCGCPSRKSVG
jgi:hypothetical protein